ncbi:MAG: hypothetical protein RLZZ417_2264 [Bacteroidota bacterium]|jgi:hypothetical protein
MPNYTPSNIYEKSIYECSLHLKTKMSSVILKIMIQNHVLGINLSCKTCRGEEAKHRVSTTISLSLPFLSLWLHWKLWLHNISPNKGSVCQNNLWFDLYLFLFGKSFFHLHPEG